MRLSTCIMNSLFDSFRRLCLLLALLLLRVRSLSPVVSALLHAVGPLFSPAVDPLFSFHLIIQRLLWIGGLVSLLPRFDELFARPHADPRVIFFHSLPPHSSSARCTWVCSLSRRCLHYVELRATRSVGSSRQTRLH